MSQLTQRGAGRSDNNRTEETPYSDANMARRIGSILSVDRVSPDTFATQLMRRSIGVLLYLLAGMLGCFVPRVAGVVIFIFMAAYYTCTSRLSNCIDCVSDEMGQDLTDLLTIPKRVFQLRPQWMSELHDCESSPQKSQYIFLE
jgi:hypothetical protein